jgi:hypothetical protein
MILSVFLCARARLETMLGATPATSATEVPHLINRRREKEPSERRNGLTMTLSFFLPPRTNCHRSGARATDLWSGAVDVATG